MDLVSLDDVRSKSNSIYSTLQVKTERDFSSAARVAETDISPQHWEALVTASASLQQNRRLEAHEMDLVQASERRHLYDKILMLVSHGEDESQISGLEEVTDSLTGRGVGQALNLSRRTATFCTRESGLLPNLFLVGASRKVLQTTFLGFPYDTPHHSIQETPWICHSCASSCEFPETIQYASVSELEREFTGIDFSLCVDKPIDAGDLSNELLLQQATDFLEWLEDRDERVVVGKSCHSMSLCYMSICVSRSLTRFFFVVAVSGDSAWLQALGCALDYKGASSNFGNGEMRIVGVRFN